MLSVAQNTPIIIPDRAELIGPLEIKCTESKCSSVFKSRSNLVLHLQKVHKKDVSLSFRQENTRFYCPEENCIYHYQRNLDEKTNNYFTELKALKQHYIKVHKAKNFECKICSKLFPDEFSLRRHEKCCGFKYFCAVCGATYRSQPCLAYHVKQKKHVFVWSEYESLAGTFVEQSNDKQKQQKQTKKKVLHQAIQTEVASSSRESKKRSISQTTQTTRTANKKKKHARPIDTKAVDSCGTKTQTEMEVASTQTLPADLSLLDDLLLTDSACQTMPQNLFCSSQTQTERDVFLAGDMQGSDSTDLMLFNHMYTQTSTYELFDVHELTDIETQTHWDTDFDYTSFYVSTETQTHYPRSSLVFVGGNPSSSSTQTSQSIEDLGRLVTEDQTNTIQCTSIHTQT